MKKIWKSDNPILHFGKCGAEQFRRIRADLGITMSDGKLSACAAYCATRLKRDPLIGELRLWDRLAAHNPAPASIGFSQLDTNDAEMARTYADMMNKRRELHPSASAPMTVGEALTLADAALTRGGKENALKGVSLLLTTPETQIVGKDLAGVVGSSASLRIADPDSAAGAVVSGDVYLLIRRGVHAPRDFQTHIRTLIADPVFSRNLRGAVRIGKQGVLPILLSSAAGLFIDLTRFGYGRDTSIEMLSDELEGDWILAVPKDLSDAVLAKIKGDGMQGTVFAAVTAGTHTAIVTSDGQTLTVDTAFLRNLGASPAVSVVLKDEAGLDAIAHLPRTHAVCRYLSEEKPFGEAVNLRNATVSAASVVLKGSPFRSSLFAVLATVLTNALTGADYPDTRFAVDLAVPSGTSGSGEMLAALLGVYRAKAELGIPATTQSIREEATDHVTVTVFNVAKDTQPLPCRLTQEGAELSLVTVPLLENGLPDFPLFRAMLDSLCRLARSGAIKAASVLVNESVTDTLRAMSGNGLKARLTDVAIASDGALPLAVLLESDESLPFRRFATVEKDGSTDVGQAEPLRIPEGNGLVWRSSPEAVILASPSDADAYVLAKRLSGLGISTTVCSPAESGLFSRALLTASMALVCRGMTIPEDPQSAFARSIFERNGGVWIAPCNPDPIPETIPHRHDPNGLPVLFR